jgi:hypothetical protein
MKIIKIAAASAVVALAIATAAALASHASLPNSGLEGTPSAKELAVFTDQGISPTRASQALSVQRQVAETHLGRRIESALAGAYAGVWFEPEAAEFHIGVTSNASRRAARRVVAQAGLTASVVETPVRSTWFALMAAQSRWDKRLAKLLANAEAATGIDTERNAVSVTLSSSVPSPERAALEHEAAAANVNVSVSAASPSELRIEPRATKTCEATFTSAKALCEVAITSGVGISCSHLAGQPCQVSEEAAVGPQCTAGPMLIQGNETYMLTSGHCFGSTSPATGKAITVSVKSAYPSEAGTQKQIGNEGIWFENKERDMAEVKVQRPGSFTEALPDPVPALVAEWSVKPNTPHAVEGVKEAVVVTPGQAVCHEGMTSGEACGEVLNVNVTINGDEHYVEVNACGSGGDSGGPYFFRTPTTKEVLMMGMETAGPKPECKETGPYKSYFEPLIGVSTAKAYGILATFAGQALLTTANEVRPQLSGPVFSFCHAKTGGSLNGTCSATGTAAVSGYANTAGRLFLCEKQEYSQFSSAFCNVLGAGEWELNSSTAAGTPLLLGVPLDPSTFKATAASIPTTISCLTGKLLAQPEATGVLSGGRSEYTNCTVEKPSGCTVTEPIVGNFTGKTITTPTDKVLFIGSKGTATTKEIFTEIEYKVCSALAGKTFPVHGQQYCEGLSGILTLKILQTLECRATESSLKMGSEPATYENRVSLDATSKEYWAILQATA